MGLILLDPGEDCGYRRVSWREGLRVLGETLLVLAFLSVAGLAAGVLRQFVVEGW